MIKQGHPLIPSYKSTPTHPPTHTHTQQKQLQNRHHKPARATEAELISQGDQVEDQEAIILLLWTLKRWTALRERWTATQEQAAKEQQEERLAYKGRVSTTDLEYLPQTTRARFTKKDACEMQQVLLSLLVMLQGGLRHEVIASITIKNLGFFDQATLCMRVGEYVR